MLNAPSRINSAARRITVSTLLGWAFGPNALRHPVPKDTAQADGDLIVCSLVATFGMSLFWAGWRLHSLLASLAPGPHGYTPMFWVGGLCAAILTLTGFCGGAMAYPFAGRLARAFYGPIAAGVVLTALIQCGFAGN